MADFKKYPTISARVSPEERKRFDLLLEELKRDQAYMVMSDLVRAKLGLDKGIELTRNQIDFLVGNLPALHGSIEPAPKPSANKAKSNKA
jgi:hypothetical protein